MMGSSAVARYWHSLTGSSASSERFAEDSRNYNFWQRYWASFIGVILPMTEMREGTQSIVGFSSSSRPVRTMPKASLGLDGWLLLPEINEPAILQASGESRVVAEAATPDGRAEFYIRWNDASRIYLLEVVVRDFQGLPIFFLLRHSTTHGEQVIAVPVVSSDVGAPSAQVELAGSDVTQRWIVRGPFPADQISAWDRGTVAASIAAAANGATREAWRTVSKSLTPELRKMVREALR